MFDTGFWMGEKKLMEIEEDTGYWILDTRTEFDRIAEISGKKEIV